MPIRDDGTFTVKVATGRRDTSADLLVVFAVGTDYRPPRAEGTAGLPDLYGNAIAEARAGRR